MNSPCCRAASVFPASFALTLVLLSLFALAAAPAADDDDVDEWRQPLDALEAALAGERPWEGAELVAAVIEADAPKDAIVELAKKHRRAFLIAYYTHIGPEGQPDLELVRPLVDRVFEPGGNSPSLAEFLAEAEDDEIVGIPAGTHSSTPKLENVVALVGMAPARSVVLTGKEKPALTISDGSPLICGLSLRQRFLTEEETMGALWVKGGGGTFVGCVAQSDSGSTYKAEGGIVKMINCLAENGKYSGFHAHGNGRMELFGCRATENDVIGFLSRESGTLIAENCTSTKNHTGYQTKDAARLELRNCNGSGNRLHGIISSDNAKAFLKDCDASNNGCCGIYSIDSGVLEAQSCTANNNGKFGFVAFTGSSMLAVDCEGSENGEGFSALEGSHLVVRKSRAVGNRYYGFKAGRGSTLIAHGCEADDNRYSGFLSVRSARAAVRNCVSMRNGSSGFSSAENSHLSVRECLSGSNKYHGFVADGASTLFAVESYAFDNEQAGFFALNDAKLLMESCRAMRSGYGGLAVGIEGDDLGSTAWVKDSRLSENAIGIEYQSPASSVRFHNMERIDNNKEFDGEPSSVELSEGDIEREMAEVREEVRAGSR